MKVINGLNSITSPIRNSILTIGVFDGVHNAHKEIIRKVVLRARKLRMKSVVVTFDPHPIKTVNPSCACPSLISLRHRIRLIAELGVDIMLVIRFTHSFAHLSSQRFVRDVLIRKLGMEEMYVGENFYFGRGGAAGISVLQKLAHEYHFGLAIIKPIRKEGVMVSSSLIRNCVIRGDIKRASRLLGRPFSILGTVVKGTMLARFLGYPTANVNPHHEAIPPSGVYAVKVKFGKNMFKGILNIGFRPTFYKEEREPTIEVHIFDFHKRIYGKDLEIIFIKKLRDERKFTTSVQLIAQIKKDEVRARALL